MTRKRKRPPQNEQELPGKHPNDTHSDNVISHHADTKYDSSFLNSLAGYGQKSGRNSKKYEKSGGVNSKRFNDNRTHQGSRRPLFDEPASEGASSNFKSEFERKYGYVEENGYVGDYGGDYGNYNGQATGEIQNQDVEDEHNEEEPPKTFPTELVAYLKNCAASIDDESEEMGDIIREKCLEECEGMEIELCTYESSSRLIEKIFKDSRKGACKWLESFMKIKKVTQLEILCSGCACRCLETLLFALSTSSDIQIIDQLSDLIVDCWSELVVNQNASHFIRSFTRHLIGLPKLDLSNSKTTALVRNPDLKHSSNLDEMSSILPSEWLHDEKALRKQFNQFNSTVGLKTIFTKIINLALDYNLMKDCINREAVSLLMQELIEYDWFARTSKTTEMILKCLGDSEGSVLLQWQGKQSSRVWEVLVKRTSEDARQSLYSSVLNGKLLELSLHPFANFVVGAFISSAKSEELIIDVFDELVNNLDQICEGEKWSVLKGLIKASSRYPEYQAALLKNLRSQFGSAQKSTRNAFLPNILTLNNAEMSEDETGKVKFNVENGTLHGSLMLQNLFTLKYNKTLLFSFLSLSDETILQMTYNPKGSRVIQAFLQSKHIDDTNKLQLANLLISKWHNLVHSKAGSYVFNLLWDYGWVEIRKKKEIMQKLCRLKNESKTPLRRIIMERLDMNGFREDPQKWTKAQNALREKLINN